MAQPGRFVGVGIDTYVSHPPLRHAVAEVRDVAERLRPAFEGEPLVEADSAQVDAYLKAVKDSAPAAPLLLLWCGHGQFAGSKLWLQTREEDGRVGVADVIERCVRSGANQLLFVFDTCNAGGGIPDAADVAAALLTELPSTARHVWFGVLVSCREPENARDGAFGKAFRRLLERGPRLTEELPELEPARRGPHD